MVTAMEDACPSGGQEDAEMKPDSSVSTQPSRGEDGGAVGRLRLVVLGWMKGYFLGWGE